MRRFAIALGMLALASTATGCGKWSQALSVAPNSGVRMAVKSADLTQANSAEEASFWKEFPATAAFLTVKSKGLDYMVASFTARVLGFNRAPALTFPLLVQNQEQFRSCLFIAKDRRVYLSELGTGHASPRFYKVGQVAGTGVSQVLTLGENDPLKVRLDSGFSFEPVVGKPATAGAPGSFELRLRLRAMPPVVAEPQLFTRVPAGAATTTEPVAAPAASTGSGLSAYLARAGAKPVVR